MRTIKRAIPVITLLLLAACEGVTQPDYSRAFARDTTATAIAADDPGDDQFSQRGKVKRDP